MRLPRIKKRWWLLLAVLFATWWTHRQLEPQRLSALVVSQINQKFNLDVRFSGAADYAFRPEPRLRLPNVSLRDDRGHVFFSAKQLDVSLPWATLTGGAPVITRLGLQSPTLDVEKLRAWLATRPAAAFEWPALDKGVAIEDGHVVGQQFDIRNLQLKAPQLRRHAPLQLAVSGEGEVASQKIALQLELKSAALEAASGYSVVVKGQWQQNKPLAFSLDAKGRFDLSEKSNLLWFDTLALRADSPLPSLACSGEIALASQLTIRLQGKLAAWPKDWPTLPAPLQQGAATMPFVFTYAGTSDLRDAMQLQLTQGQTRFDANLHWPQLQSWLAKTDASPLPPLDATLSTPALDLDGVSLQGVQMKLHDGDAARH